MDPEHITGGIAEKEQMKSSECVLPEHKELEPVYKWADITEEFFKSVSCLHLGELFHDELTFGLFEAMSAIEMMDPKMDAGMLRKQDKKRIHNFDQAIAENRLKLRGLSFTEQITVIDRTNACLVSWIEGNSLAQTVFTNLYIHRPHSIETRPLKAFCICVYKIIDLIRDIITRAYAFEEEDFQPALFEFKLYPDVPDHRVLCVLREAETELNESIHSKDASISEDDAIALNSRMRLIRFFYQLLTFIKRNEVHSGKLGDCVNILSTCTELISFILKTADKYSVPDDPELEVFGFEPTINQRLLPPTFPRYTKIRSNIGTYQYFEQLVLHFKKSFKITSCSSYHDALNYFIEISQGKPCILSRSVMQLLYLPEPALVLGTTSMMEILRDSAKKFVSPPSLAPRSLYINNPQAKDYIDLFFAHCVRPFTNLVRLCGHNRARQRHKLAHLLEDFAALQDEAERLDRFLHDLALKIDPTKSHLTLYSTWILYYVLRIMSMYLLSGFELELYSTHEYAYIYWYLKEFLFGWLISALTRAETLLLCQENSNSENSKSNAKSRRSSKTSKKKKPRCYENEIILYRALQTICGAYYKAAIAFHMDGKIRTPYEVLDNERVRYEHRFLPFSMLITPPVIQYAEFRNMTETLRITGIHALYFSSSRQFSQALTIMESIQHPSQEINALIKIVKTNSVLLRVLSSDHKRGPSYPLNFDFSHHHYFPMFKLL